MVHYDDDSQLLNNCELQQKRIVFCIINNLLNGEKMNNNLKTVIQMLNDNKFLTNGGLRALIFNADSNGLNQQGVIVRIGRKVLIDEDKFFNWLESQNQGVAA